MTKKSLPSKIVRIPPAPYEKLRKEAFKLRKPMSVVVAEAINLFFNQKKSA